jgi:hypothetical protein
VHAVAASDAHARGAAAFHLVAWCAAVAPVLVLKHTTQRRRPVTCEAEHVGAEVLRASERKRLANICAMLRSGDANAAFPSGDVAGSVTFAYPIWRCAEESGSPPALRLLAVACVCLSATGRMYWCAAATPLRACSARARPCLARRRVPCATDAHVFAVLTCVSAWFASLRGRASLSWLSCVSCVVCELGVAGRRTTSST